MFVGANLGRVKASAACESGAGSIAENVLAKLVLRVRVSRNELGA